MLSKKYLNLYHLLIPNSVLISKAQTSPVSARIAPQGNAVGPGVSGPLVVQGGPAPESRETPKTAPCLTLYIVPIVNM